MGLDQYLYKTKKEMTVEKLEETNILYNEDKITEKEYYEITGIKEIGYWRKHHALQAHCEDLWEKLDPKNKKEIFNCKYLELEEDTITDIITLSENHEMENVDYFGYSNEYDDEQTITIMTEALKAINKGYKIFYYSWW